MISIEARRGALRRAAPVSQRRHGRVWRADFAVDVEDLSVDADIERPARSGRFVVSDYAIRLRGTTFRVAEERVIHVKLRSKLLVSSRESTLTAKNATSNSRIWSPLSRSDWHCAVQPALNARANQASTTACFPRYSASRYVRPSVPGSSKSGATSPGCSVRATALAPQICLAETDTDQATPTITSALISLLIAIHLPTNELRA